VHGLAYVFINYEQAATLGHVGWGFSLGLSGEDLFYFGSTDHLWPHRWPHGWWNLFTLANYMHVPDKVNNDWWADDGSERHMLETMRAGHHVRYHAYKVIEVRESFPQSARTLAESLRKTGWNVLFNNCVHQSHRVLSAYGATSQLPDPSRSTRHLVPRSWFKAIAADERVL
jgi:hypothetical protein